MVFGKKDCHLCDEVEAEIASMKETGVSLTVVDITSTPALHDKYWMRVPVVTVGGEEVFEAKMMDLQGAWRKRLAALLGER